MKIRSMAVVVLLVAIAFTVLKALITRKGIGPFEYATGALLVLGVLTTAVHVSRRALRS
jgi:hypothetical protein